MGALRVPDRYKLRCLERQGRILVGHEPAEASALRLIDWTGERCVPWAHDLQVVYEHYHRYLLAQRLVGGRTVLDLASGEGYGAALLAENAKAVVGVEIDARAVAHSKRAYDLPGLTFVEGSMVDLRAFPDGSFDVVTCFEAIEHVMEHERVLAEVRRVLKADGLFLMSTPDRLQYTDHSHQDNPFHVRELSTAELRELLEAVFPQVAIWGQSLVLGSLVLTTEVPGTAEVLVLQREHDRWISGDSDVRATYSVALASRAELPTFPAHSLMIDPRLGLLRGAQRQVQEQAEAVTAMSSLLLAREAEVAHRDADIVTLNAEVRRLQARVASYETRLQAADEKLRDPRAPTEREGSCGPATSDCLTVEAELAALQASAGVRLVLRYRRLLDVVAPPGTRRRKSYLVASHRLRRRLVPTDSGGVSATR